HRIGARMDFDTDILVRLYWEGAPVRNIPTHIVYQADIASHFDILRDNLRIIRMHTRLPLGMLRRLPRLVMRNPHEPYFLQETTYVRHRHRTPAAQPRRGVQPRGRAPSRA